MTVIEQNSDELKFDEDVVLPEFAGRTAEELRKILLNYVAVAATPALSEEIPAWADIELRVAAGAARALNAGGHIGSNGIVDDPKKLN